MADLGKKAFGSLHSQSMEIRLARTPAEVDAAQALRYRIFYEEKGAHPSAETRRTKRDVDAFDAICDHLVVLDHERGDGPAAIVGTYRLIRRSQMLSIGRFYSADEYDLSKLLSIPGEIVELGRSCVNVGYRSRNTMQLLWRGIAAYVFHYDIVLMFGCGSLHGTDLETLATPLSYLYHNHLAPEDLRVRALPERHTEMQRLPAESIDRREALNALPPLIKGYLRLGGFVGDGAVIDEQFNTTDVCVLVKTDLVTSKYYNHYGRTLLGEGGVRSGQGDADGDEPA